MHLNKYISKYIHLSSNCIYPISKELIKNSFKIVTEYVNNRNQPFQNAILCPMCFRNQTKFKFKIITYKFKGEQEFELYFLDIEALVFFYELVKLIRFKKFANTIEKTIFLRNTLNRLTELKLLMYNLDDKTPWLSFTLEGHAIYNCIKNNLYIAETMERRNGKINPYLPLLWRKMGRNKI